MSKVYCKRPDLTSLMSLQHVTYCVFVGYTPTTQHPSPTTHHPSPTTQHPSPTLHCNPSTSSARTWLYFKNWKLLVQIVMNIHSFTCGININGCMKYFIFYRNYSIVYVQGIQLSQDNANVIHVNKCQIFCTISNQKTSVWEKLKQNMPVLFLKIKAYLFEAPIA